MSRTILFSNGYIYTKVFQKDNVHEKAMFMKSEQINKLNILAARREPQKTDAAKLRGIFHN